MDVDAFVWFGHEKLKKEDAKKFKEALEKENCDTSDFTIKNDANAKAYFQERQVACLIYFNFYETRAENGKQLKIN